MSAVDKAALLASRGAPSTQTVEVGALGSVTVRGLSRAEALALRKGGVGDEAGAEARLLSFALVDPVLTVDEAKAWQAVASIEEIEAVTAAVLVLSGLTDAAPKEAMGTFRD